MLPSVPTLTLSIFPLPYTPSPSSLPFSPDLEIIIMNNYLGYYNVYISNYFLKRPQFDAMQKNSLFLLITKVYQSSSNHEAGMSATNLFKVTLY